MFSLLPFCGRKEHRQKRHETLEKCQRGSRWLAGRMAGGCRFCPAVWPSPIDLAGAAVPPDRSYRRRSCACVIRVDVALARAAGSRHRALDQRKVGAILIAASPHGDEVHANRKIWIIRLSPGSPCCRDHSCRQNSQGQNTHRNLSRDFQQGIRAQQQNGHVDSSQYTFTHCASPWRVETHTSRAWAGQ